MTTPKRGRPATGALYPIRFVVSVSKKMRADLRARGGTEGKTINQVVRDAISAHLYGHTKIPAIEFADGD